MPDLASLIDAYPSLSPDERATVDARVAERPELAAAYAGARRLAALFDAATAPFDADDVARRAAARHLGLPLSDDDPEADAARWAAEAELIAARLDALDASAEDPVLRYERLVNETSGTGQDATSQDAASAVPGTLFRSAAPDRPALRLLHVRRWAVAATVLLVAYGGLFAVSSATAPERARVAALGEIDATAPLALRGGGAPASDGASDAARLTDALGEIDAARHTTLGLFPTYDDDGLAAAVAALERLSGDVDSASWVSHEARFALGRVLFYQGHDVEAARVLGGLVEQGSYRGAAARRVLDAIRAGA